MQIYKRDNSLVKSTMLSNIVVFVITLISVDRINICQAGIFSSEATL